MTSSSKQLSSLDSPGISLHSGDRMTRNEFHSLYETADENFRAELIGGIVFVRQSLGRNHGSSHVRLSSAADRYAASTSGIEVCDNSTVFLSAKDEVQPDLFIRILPEYGGQSHNAYEGQYVAGAPEFVAEVAHSSKAIDLHGKLRRYEKCGVREYVVLCLSPKKLYWFDLSKSTQHRSPNEQGVFKSSAFPGLWIHGEALLSLNYKLLMQTVDEGLSSPDHALFVEHLSSKVVNNSSSQFR
jgi:hypothetical protein